MTKTCSIDDCGTAVYGRGWCKSHYQRWYRNGDPLKRKCNANGEGGISAQGYKILSIDGLRKAEHIAIAEKAIGHRLPKGAQVHHVNGIKTDNRPSNLVVCESNEYHALLHSRQKAMDECGDPNKRKCRHCGSYDDVENLYVMPGTNGNGHHRKCRQLNRGAA